MAVPHDNAMHMWVRNNNINSSIFVNHHVYFTTWTPWPRQSPSTVALREVASWRLNSCSTSWNWLPLHFTNFGKDKSPTKGTSSQVSPVTLLPASNKAPTTSAWQYRMAVLRAVSPSTRRSILLSFTFRRSSTPAMSPSTWKKQVVYKEWWIPGTILIINHQTLSHLSTSQSNNPTMPLKTPRIIGAKWPKRLSKVFRLRSLHSSWLPFRWRAGQSCADHDELQLSTNHLHQGIFLPQDPLEPRRFMNDILRTTWDS